jgi:hypothetical protein
MKKILFMSLLAGSLALTACDPAQEKVDNNKVYSSAEDILNGITFTQYSDEDLTVPADDGNYIFYQTNPGRPVQIYNFRGDGSMNLMASGASGSFALKPGRGSDPNQTFYIRTLNSDGSVTETSTSLTVYVQQELDPELRYLASDAYGSKVWKWDPTFVTDGDWAGVVWGNMGYAGDTGYDAAKGSTTWWGVKTSDEFNGQLQHTEDGTNHGDGDLDAYMVFTDEGVLTSYDASGNVIRTGAYQVEGFDLNAVWRKGLLKTTAILWPYEINSGGNVPGEYEIIHLTSSEMTLAYPDGGDYAGFGNWGEATYWHFYSNSDVKGMIMGYEGGKDWTWDPSFVTDGDWAGVVWGNMGYAGDTGYDAAKGSTTWWGVKTSDEFNGQLQHTEDGTNHGDGDLDAYMTFGTDGTITSYDANGGAIRTGTFEIDESVANGVWKVGDLKTNAILWPYEINSGGNIPGIYEIIYLSGTQMTLTYPDGGDFGGLGNWGEATYWHFKAK